MIWHERTINGIKPLIFSDQEEIDFWISDGGDLKSIVELEGQELNKKYNGGKIQIQIRGDKKTGKVCYNL